MLPNLHRKVFNPSDHCINTALVAGACFARATVTLVPPVWVLQCNSCRLFKGDRHVDMPPTEFAVLPEPLIIPRRRRVSVSNKCALACLQLDGRCSFAIQVETPNRIIDSSRLTAASWVGWTSRPWGPSNPPVIDAGTLSAWRNGVIQEFKLTGGTQYDLAAADPKASGRVRRCGCECQCA